MNFLSEFRQFATRGNVVDMAVGIVIGAAFTNIVNTLVNNILMPPIGLLLGKMNFADLALVLQTKTATSPGVAINYGLFINAVVNFIIVAFVIFILIKQINRLRGNKPPTTKVCGYCDSTISIKAIKCPQCTSSLNDN